MVVVPTTMLEATGSYWVIGCDHVGVGFARLYIPIVAPGDFNASLTPATVGKTDFQFSATATDSLLMSSSNFVAATLAGTVTATAGPPVSRTVTGTVHASWSAPMPTCTALSGTLCGTADLNVNFRYHTGTGTCLTNSDCVAPKTCSPAGLECF